MHVEDRQPQAGRQGGRLTGLVIVAFLLGAASAHAAPPATPTVTEPVTGATPDPADVHMEATGFSDPDVGDIHQCSAWEIRTQPADELVWEAPCEGGGGGHKVHIHLADGEFVGSYAGRSELLFDTDYRLRVRFVDDNDEPSEWAEQDFTTSPAGPPGTAGGLPWTPRQPGYRVEEVAGGLQLPVNVAFVPQPGGGPGDPFAYVTELYGRIQVVTRDGSVESYAHGLLNFNPTGFFPGSGEQGVTGIAVDPATGDVFASMLYEDGGSGDHYAKVVRFHSTDGGQTAATKATILDMPGESYIESHQISNLSIGPDGMVYVHTGDGFEFTTAQDLDSFRGKILRVTLDGDPAPTNPFYDASDGLTARDYVYAYGFRNPFGGAWRAADATLYEVENGPTVDRFVRVIPGRNYLWDGTDASMSAFALYNWDPAHAPTNIAFVQPQTQSGSGFPDAKMDHAFVAESGPTYATGPRARGKRIVEFAPNSAGGFSGPTDLVEYTGTGKATAAGLAAGPDGLYFTELYRDQGYSSPIDPGARLLRVRYVGAGGSEVGTLPDTTITKGPRRKVRTRRRKPRARFLFTSTQPGASFECKLDKRSFEPCDPPHRLKTRAHRKRFEKHAFLVRAKGAAGTDPSPARHRWKSKRRR